MASIGKLPTEGQEMYKYDLSSHCRFKSFGSLSVIQKAKT